MHNFVFGNEDIKLIGRRQAIIWTNARILLIRSLWTNFSDIEIEILKFPFKEMHLEMSSGKCRPSYFGLNVLTFDFLVSEKDTRGYLSQQFPKYVRNYLSLWLEHHGYDLIHTYP